ncbi:MAG: class I SAM-dependent methyltransferase [Deltaproteobacteria bacterium]|jgi:SAM-dependent methyltransferase|nr:class I SAM-dependent methyltransferase [Deltaproteobacteria bacterium]
MSEAEKPCPICGTASQYACSRRGRTAPIKDYALFHCPGCHFSFIPDYRTDFANVYTEAYYRGEGADPMVNYLYDHQYPRETLRSLEWEGIARVFHFLKGKDNPEAKWLDYGCGMGSLTRHAREKGLSAFGYEPYGQAPDEGEGSEGSFILGAESLSREGPFDFVTAIEVIEHDPEPVAFLRRIRPLLKEGGILFLTTGNAWPYRHKLDSWSYAGIPDAHMSFFEPGALALAMEKSGFRPEFKGFAPGFSQIIAYKILKNLGFTRRSPVWRLVPWPLVSRLADSRFKVTAHPVGVAA